MGNSNRPDNGAGMGLEVVEASGRCRWSTNRRSVAAEHGAERLKMGIPCTQATALILVLGAQWVPMEPKDVVPRPPTERRTHFHEMATGAVCP